MNRLTWIALLGAALFSSACSASEPVGSAAHGLRIVVLGSSTAAGWGTSAPDSSWVNRYRAYLRAADPGDTVINLAVGGYTSYHIMRTGFAPPPDRPAPDSLHNITRALALRPDAIIINLPSNDIAYGFTVAEQLAMYDSVLAAARGAGVPVWVATSQPRDLSEDGRARLAAMRDSTFARYDGYALDFWTGLAGVDGTIDKRYGAGDGIHLDDAGHRILFERVVEAAIPQRARSGAAGPPSR